MGSHLSHLSRSYVLFAALFVDDDGRRTHEILRTWNHDPSYRRSEEKRDKLVEFFSKNIHNKYNIYYYGFIFCEFLNMTIVLICFAITNKFLNGTYTFYGFDVLRFYNMPYEEQTMTNTKNPMCITFPRIAACDYYRYGSGGVQENVNALCILALNIINDKVFLILWFWMFFLIFSDYVA